MGDDRARRYAPDIGPLAGVRDDSPESLGALAELVPSGGMLALTALVIAVVGIVCLWRHSVTWGLIGLLAVVVLGPGIMIFGLNVWQHTPLGRKMIGAPTEEEQQVRAIEEEKERAGRLALLGAEGVALTDLRPVGVVQINGHRYDALSEASLIPARTKVRVTVVESNQIKVRAIA